MNTHKILLGALLIKPNLAPYALPDLEIEYFPADLQPVFAALSGFWNATGKLDAVEACARYPEQSTACLLYTSPSPRDISGSRMPSSA